MGLKWHEVIKDVKAKKRAATPQEIKCLESMVARSKRREEHGVAADFQTKLDWLRRQPEKEEA